MEFTPEDLGIRKRCFPKENYIGIYLNHKTIRVPIDKTKPILELEYPEFYDVKITNACTGECVYCYQDSVIEDHYPDVIQKINDFFGPMDMNQRPFQVAIGGGNPNEHPDFIKVLQAFHDLGITPNYTTNGIGMADGNIIQATKDLCGGVAITCHRHLDHDWRYAKEQEFVPTFIFSLRQWEMSNSLKKFSKSIIRMLNTSFFCHFFLREELPN